MMMRIVPIFLLLCTPALAHDPSHPELNEWFNRLASGKGLCCSFADGFVVSDVDWESKDGHYRVRLEGRWIDVPDDAVITEHKPCWQDYGLALHGRSRDRSSAY
jgi:hypothetical protein